jgi:ribosomal protein S18 acetylase RimI-like enzyme
LRKIGHNFCAKDIEVQQIQTIKPLWEALNVLHAECSPHFATVFRKLTFEARMAPLIEGDPNDIKVTVIEDDKDICAYCMSTITGPTGEIHSLYTREDRRNKHLGRTLVSLHQEWFKERRCTSIKLSVVFGNESVLDFYRKLGFFELAVELRQIS